MRYKIILIATLILGVAVIILAQFSIPTLFDADGYYHIRLAKFISQYGPYLNFHWARYSILADHFADKDFLYHLLLIPFALLPNMFLGTKIAATIFATGLFLVFFWLLRRYAKLGLAAPFLVIFFLAPHFLAAISFPRPRVLILALTLLFVHFLIKKNWRALALISIIYSLTHSTGPFLLLFALLVESVRYIDERRFETKTIFGVGAGVVIGALIHPHFPNNLLMFYLNAILTPAYGLKWGLELGAEMFPLSTRDFALEYPFILGGVMLLLALAASSGNKTRTATKIWMAMAGLFFGLSFFSHYYVVHSYPFILLAVAAYISDWWDSRGHLLGIFSHKILMRRLAPVIIAVVLAVAGLNTYKSFCYLAIAQMYYNLHYERIAKWMSENIPPGELIFHTNWSDGQYFIGLNPRDDYFVAMDALYMYYRDPKKYKLYREVSFGRASDPYTVLKDDFGVRYGYAGKNYFSGLIQQIRPDSRFEILAEDGMGLVFKLK